MKRNVSLTIASLLSLLLLTIHIADDIVRGMSGAGLENMFGILIFVTWLYGAVALAERRSGYVIMLLGGLFAAAMPVIHMDGEGAGDIARSSGGFFFIWNLLAVGTLGAFAVILSARGLWNMRSTRRVIPGAGQ